MELRPYQINDIVEYIRNPRIMNRSDPGTGKTPPTCVFTYWLWNEQGQRTIWVQPKSIIDKNREELLTWSHFKSDEVIIIDGPPAARKKDYARNAKVWLFGPDMLSREWELLFNEHSDIGMVVGDEWHMMFGTHESKRTQSLYRLMRKVPRLIPMTGTLINGRYSSAFPAINLIEPRYYGNVVAFNNTHGIFDEWGSIIGWKNPERLKEILDRHSIKHTFEEAYGKEAKVVLPEFVVMKPKMKAMYDELHEKAMIELEDRFVDAGIPGVAALRARQVLSCPEIFELADEAPAKDDRLEIHFADGGPLVVFAVFKPEQERLLRLAEKCGRKAELMNGDTPAAERARIDQRFQAGVTDTIICSPRVAQVGFNWGHMERVVFYSLEYQDGDFLQAYRRGIRGKRDKPLLIYVMQYRDTIDKRIVQIIRRKSREANAIDDNREIFDFKETG